MRKLMIAMLALAVVFGFAACDNSNSGSTSLMDKYVVALEVTDGPKAYFEGDAVDVADYTITATRNDGSTFVVAANELAFSNGAALTANEGDPDKTIGTIEYTGIYVGTIKTPSVAVEADVYEVDAINVAVTADQPTYYNGSSLKNLKDDYTVTAYAFADTVTDTSKATAEDALYYAVIDSSDITLYAGATALTSDYTFASAGLKEISFRLFGTEESQAIKDGQATADLVVMTDYVVDFTVAAVTPETAKGTKGSGYKYAVVGDTIDISDNSKLYLVLTETKASGEVNTYVGSEITAPYVVEWTNASTTGTFGSSSVGMTIKGKENNADASMTYDLGTVANDIESFTVSTTKEINPGDTIKNTDFKVTATWLGTTKPVTDTNLVASLTIDGGKEYKVPSYYPAGTAIGVEFALDGYGAKCTNADTIMTKAN